MRIALNRLSAAVILVGGLAACSKGTNKADSAGGAVAADTTPAAATIAPPPVTGLKVVATDTLGRYITDAAGRALYTFTKDKKDSSTCSAKCADAWQPYGDAQAVTASDTTVDHAKIATITRADGKTQVTYDGKPLYYYKDDVNADQTTGQSKKAFGGTWYLVAPDGDMIKSAKGAMAKVDTALHKAARAVDTATQKMKKP